MAGASSAGGTPVTSEIPDDHVSEGATPTTPLADVPCLTSLRILGTFNRDAGSVRNRSSIPAMEITMSLWALGLRADCARRSAGRTTAAKRNRSNPDFTVVQSIIDY
jgi:hypothetical protein